MMTKYTTSIFGYNNMKASLIFFFLTLRSHSSAECSRSKYNKSFHFPCFFFILMGILMGNITPQIFYQSVFLFLHAYFTHMRMLSEKTTEIIFL